MQWFSPEKKQRYGKMEIVEKLSWHKHNSQVNQTQIRTIDNNSCRLMKKFTIKL